MACSSSRPAAMIRHICPDMRPSSCIFAPPCGLSFCSSLTWLRAILQPSCSDWFICRHPTTRVCPSWLQVDPSGASLTVSFFSLTLQVDQSGTSLTVSRFSLGGITWSSVSIPAPVSAPSPPAPASESPHPESSSRRMLLHASEPRPPVVFLSPPASHGDWSLPSENQPDGRPLGFRSLQASGSTCAPTIMRCATRVLPPHGRRGGP